MAHSRNPHKDYNWKLRLAIQEMFIQSIVPSNVLPYFGKHGEGRILVQADYQMIEATTDRKGPMAGASVLLDRLCVYKDWYECIIKVLRDREVKLSHVADYMDKQKSSLDSKLQQVELDGGDPEEETSLEYLLQEGLETGGSKPDDVRPKTSHLTVTRDSKTKLTDTLYTELRKVDKAIEKLHNEHEANVRQLEQENEQELKSYQDQVKELKKEREKLDQLIQQERKHQRDQINALQAETRQKEKLIAEGDTQITNLRHAIGNLEIERKRSDTSRRAISDLLSGTQDNVGVILFNYYVMNRMREDHPDLPKKYNIQEWSIPSHLTGAAAWVVRSIYAYYETQIECVLSVREGGLTAAKEITQTKLRGILNDVNKRKEEAMDEDEEKYWLQDDIRDFFSSCYWCLIEFDGHYNDSQQYIIFVHHIISGELDKVICSISDWADVLSQDTDTKWMLFD